MDMQISPSLLQGEVTAPPSKSAAHRALLAAALGQGKSTVSPIVLSRDIAATIACIEALGGRLQIEEKKAIVTPVAGLAAVSRLTLPCGESGSTLRFMLPVCAALLQKGQSARFTGAGRLPHRPLGILVDLLAARGCAIVPEGDAPMPFVVSGQMQSGRYELPGDISSQFVTGLLFALPLLEGDSEIVLTSPLQSAGYVDMTLETLAEAGIRVAKTPTGFHAPGGQIYCGGAFAVEGDDSGGAFWLAAGALGGDITCGGLRTQTSQRDRAIVELLKRFGAGITLRPEGDALSIHSRPGTLKTGGDIDVRHIPDLVPILAVVAALAKGTTRITGGERLRLKESDRIASTLRMIRSLGGRAEETPDGLIIEGGAMLAGGTVESFDDHRIVMAAAVAATRCEQPVIITGAQAVAKSYPDFFDEYTRLGGNCHVL